jgi:hypothetical protein
MESFEIYNIVHGVRNSTIFVTLKIGSTSKAKQRESFCCYVSTTFCSIFIHSFAHQVGERKTSTENTLQSMNVHATFLVL